MNIITQAFLYLSIYIYIYIYTLMQQAVLPLLDYILLKSTVGRMHCTVVCTIYM